MTDRYYINRTHCFVHNKKTKELADILKNFEQTEIKFNDSFTPHDLFNTLKESVSRINSQYRGRSIEVEMHNYDITGNINYVFSDNPNSGDSVANLILYPIHKTISSL